MLPITGPWTRTRSRARAAAAAALAAEVVSSATQTAAAVTTATQTGAAAVAPQRTGRRSSVVALDPGTPSNSSSVRNIRRPSRSVQLPHGSGGSRTGQRTSVLPTASTIAHRRQRVLLPRTRSAPVVTENVEATSNAGAEAVSTPQASVDAPALPMPMPTNEPFPYESVESMAMHANYMDTGSLYNNRQQLARKRLLKELEEIRTEPPENCSAGINEDDMFCWDAYIFGPSGSPYENGKFRLRLNFSEDYPFRPPFVYFITRIYHCNINKDGHVCLDILSHQWSPALTVSKVLLSVISLLTDPNPNDPLETAIAEQYLRDRKAHDETARTWTQRYAGIQ